jgi:hypothetical protein
LAGIWDDFVMQGFERMDGVLLDAAVGHLVPAGSMFAFLAAHRAEVFPDADYADLFAPPGVGRPSLPATRMAAVLTLQVLHDYSDRETAEAARFDVRWKAATGVPLDDPGSGPSSLVYWRNRIAKSARPHRISDAVQKVVRETGVLRGRRRRAVDSTILADAVATQDTVTQLVAAIRKVAREVPGAAEQVARVCTGHDYSRPGKPAIDWDDPAAKDGLVSALVNDEKLTRAAGTENSDPAVAEQFLAAEAGSPSAPGAGGPGDGAAAGRDLSWYGDSAYGTGDLRGAVCDAGHRAVIKPKPLQAPVEGGFTIDDFTVDEQQGTVTCPAGRTVPLSRTRTATFGVRCRSCPLRERCTTSKTGRTLALHPRDDLLRAARADWAAGSGLREDYMTHRPNVERAIAQVATWRGRRLSLRYRGTAKNDAWLKRRTAALNLHNLIGKGLARHDGAWALAT